PVLRLLGRVTGRVGARLLRFAGVDPRLEVFGPQLREGEGQVAEVTLGVDGQDWHPVNGGFLDEADAQPGLAAAGHADDDCVGGQVAGVVEHGLAGHGHVIGLDLAAQVEGAQFLEVHVVSYVTTAGRGTRSGPRGPSVRRLWLLP